MSVAAMTMDDQRPLMNNFDKMSKQYEQNLQGGVGSGGSGAPPSGPASPTPSGSEESPSTASQHQQYSLHSHHHHHQASHHMSLHQHQHPHHHHQHHQSQYHHHRHQHATAVMAGEQPSPPSPTHAHQHQQQQQQQHQQHEQQQQPSLSSTANTAAAVALVEQRQRLLEDEIEGLKLEQTRLSQQSADAQRREKILMRRLANKEQEFQDYVSQIAEYKAAQAPSALALRSALLDPAVNLLFEKLKKELKATKAKLEETQNELSAWKFTPDSNTGKRLMAKCRLLYQENEELGKMTSSGRVSKLETELAMQKNFRDEVKKSQSEFDDFLQELDEDVEGMQSTIHFLQQELKMARDRIQGLEKENYQLKNGVTQEVAKVEMIDAQLSLNGGVNSNNKAISTLSYNSLQQTTVVNMTGNNSELKYQSNTLETIEENSYLRTPLPAAHAHANVTVNDFYNGKNVISEEAQATPPPAVAGGDDGSNSSSNNSMSGKFRTAASRKRNYDSDSNENNPIATSAIPAATAAVGLTAGTVAAPQVITPRTLPPKKSKLRVTPARRASAQSVEMPDHDARAGTSMCDPLGVGVGSIVVDNAVAGMANEETMSVDDEPGIDGGVSQRIMTRRRSVRTQQQNGNGGGAGGAESNH